MLVPEIPVVTLPAAQEITPFPLSNYLHDSEH